MNHYAHCGLRIASELALPELDAADAPEEPDVHVRLGEPGPDAGETPSFTVSDDACEIWFPDAGHYAVRHGTEIVVRPQRDATPARLTLFLLGTAWAAVLHQRGALPLHAGVVANGEEAIAFCGPQGAGKSSLVAQLVAEGHGLVSDDLTRLEVGDDGSPVVWPSTPRLKLAPEAFAAAGLPSEEAQARTPDGKLHLRWTAARPDGPLPLGALYVLAWGEPAVTELRGGEAVERLVAAATYRPQLIATKQAQARHWRQCVAIARRIPVRELRRPRDWSPVEWAGQAE